MIKTVFFLVMGGFLVMAFLLGLVVRAGWLEQRAVSEPWQMRKAKG